MFDKYKRTLNEYKLNEVSSLKKLHFKISVFNEFLPTYGKGKVGFEVGRHQD